MAVPRACSRHPADVVRSFPRISVCRMSPQSALCEGCLRTIDEIAHWSTMDDAQKRVVLAVVAQRRAAAKTGAGS